MGFGTIGRKHDNTWNVILVGFRITKIFNIRSKIVIEGIDCALILGFLKHRSLGTW